MASNAFSVDKSNANSMFEYHKIQCILWKSRRNTFQANEYRQALTTFAITSYWDPGQPVQMRSNHESPSLESLQQRSHHRSFCTTERNSVAGVIFTCPQRPLVLLSGIQSTGVLPTPLRTYSGCFTIFRSSGRSGSSDGSVSRKTSLFARRGRAAIRKPNKKMKNFLSLGA